MRVATRLILIGAVLPAAGVVAAALGAGQIFARDLLHSVDEGLRSQAAVESVSLFDGPGGEPHLHLHESPRAEQPMRTRGLVAVYGTDGAPLLHFPAMAEVPATVPVRPDHDDGPRTVVDEQGGERRELIMHLTSRDGHRYTLWLAQPLDRLRATTAAFYRATLSAGAALALLLAIVQAWQARRLSRRITAVSSHLPCLREGDFDSAPPADRVGDEVSELRDALVEVTAQLKAARDRQERLIANAAHELRTPLGLMRTEMDLALRRERSPEELREALTEVRGEVDRLAVLAQRLLDLAAIRSVTLERQSGDLGALVGEALDACRAAATERGVELRQAGERQVRAIFAPLRIRQAVDNLLSNAIRFAPPHSIVAVAVRPAERAWRIHVTDAGPGVAEADRERVFEPFWRGREDGHGAGLGLAIVREVAREHGGAVWIEPAGDRTEFVIELPAEGPID